MGPHRSPKGRRLHRSLTEPAAPPSGTAPGRDAPTPRDRCRLHRGRAGPERAGTFAPAPPPDPEVAQLCRALLRRLEAERAAVEPHGAALGDALRRYLRYASAAAGPRSPAALHGLTSQRLDVVLGVIDSDLAGANDLAALAALAGLSPAHFARQFKAATGLPPHRYLIHRRVARACDLLAGGDASIAQVALAVGFFDQSHLDRHVKRLLGVSPRDLRGSGIVRG